MSSSFSVFQGGATAIGDGILVSNGVSQLNELSEYINSTGKVAESESEAVEFEEYDNEQKGVEEMREEYNRRRRYVLSGLERIGLPTCNPAGAFYVFPCIKSTGFTSEEFCEKLLQEEKVAVVPGTAFGDSGEGFVRISYAYSLEALKKALERIRRFLEKH